MTPAGELEPKLATEWSSSSDAKVWTFKIRKGVQFHNGKEMTAADVQMSFVAEVARVQGALPAYPNFNAWLDRIHARPAWKRAIEKGGAYELGR